MTPGALRGDVRLVLQTRHAQRLLEGRPQAADRPAIRGLMGFADRARVVWQAAQADDPYADWYLLKIEARLQQSAKTLRLLASQIAEVAGRSSLEWSAGESSKPVRVQLRFATPYAYRGSHVLADFDRLARTLLTSRFLGVIGAAEADTLLARGGRAVRSAFDSPNGYQRFDVDREAVLTGTPQALKAQAAMGELPAEVLAEERLAELRPQRFDRRAVIDDLEGLQGGGREEDPDSYPGSVDLPSDLDAQV